MSLHLNKINQTLTRMMEKKGWSANQSDRPIVAGGYSLSKKGCKAGSMNVKIKQRSAAFSVISRERAKRRLSGSKKLGGA